MSLRDLRALSRLMDTAANPANFFGGQSLWQPPQALFDYEPTSTIASPSVSIEEKGDGYEIIADVPSFKKDEVHVHLGDQNRRLILEGATKSHERIRPVEQEQQAQQQQQQQAEGETTVTRREEGGQVGRPLQTYLIQERASYATFRRSFHFANALDPKSIKAKLEHGQLKVTVQKQTEDEGVTSISVE